MAPAILLLGLGTRPPRTPMLWSAMHAFFFSGFVSEGRFLVRIVGNVELLLPFVKRVMGTVCDRYHKCSLFCCEHSWASLKLLIHVFQKLSWFPRWTRWLRRTVDADACLLDAFCSASTSITTTTSCLAFSSLFIFCKLGFLSEWQGPGSSGH